MSNGNPQNKVDSATDKSESSGIFFCKKFIDKKIESGNIHFKKDRFEVISSKVKSGEILHFL